MRILLASLLLAQGCARQSSRDAGTAAEPAILLGVVGALTGAEASFGQSTLDGVQLAVEDANADGGVLGRQVRLRVYDSQGKPEEAAAATTRLVTQDRVVAILGENASSSSLAMAAVAQGASVPMVTPSSTNPAVTEVGDFIFRTCFIDELQGKAMAGYATGPLGLTRVAVLSDRKSAYAEGLARVFSAALEERGGQVVASLTYARGDTDFRALITRLKTVKPQALYVPGYYQDVAAIAEQARELGLKVQFLGSDGWSSRRLLELAAGALEGAVFTDNYAVDDPQPASRAFIERFTARFGRPPDGNAALGHDAALVVLDALRRAGTTRGRELRDALAATGELPGVAGPISFDARRNPKKPVVVVTVKDDRFTFRDSIAP